MSNIQNQAREYYNNGIQLYLSKQYGKALTEFENGISNDWLFTFAHLWKAKTLVKLKKYGEGIEYFQNYVSDTKLSKHKSYVIQFCNTLIEEKQFTDALSIVELEHSLYEGRQFLDYLFIFLANDKRQQVIHQILNIPIKDKPLDAYSYLLNNEYLKSEIYESLRKNDIVPTYFDLIEKIGVIKKISIQNKEYIKLLDQIRQLKINIRENPDCNYLSQLESLKEKIKKIEVIFLNHGNLCLKTKSLNQAIRIHDALKKINSQIKGIEVFEDKLKIAKNKRHKKRLVFVYVSIFILAVAGITSNIIYESKKQRSNDFKYAIQKDSLNLYNQYLEKHGDNSEIHKYRERKLHNLALENNTINDIEQLTSLYPDSKYLKAIKLNVVKDENTKVKVFALNSEKLYISPSENNLYRLPVGCVIGYSIQQNNKIPITKYFTVVQDMTINEALYDSKTILFRESFVDNKNNWTTLNKTKKTKNNINKQEIQFNNGSLQLTNEYGNDFVFSTIDIDEYMGKTNVEIVASIQSNTINNGIFLIYGGNKRGFYYLGFNDEEQYIYGYKKSNKRIIKRNSNWISSDSIQKNKQSHDTLRVIKENENIEFRFNDKQIGSTSLKKWYGSQVGFGINNNTKAKILDLTIYQNHERINTDFINGKIYYCWLKNLNIRNREHKGKPIRTIQKGDPVKYLGKKGRRIVPATFKEIYSPDFYYLVELVDGTIGWVHGGGLHSLDTNESIDFKEFKNSVNPN